MEHVVFFLSPEGAPAFRRLPSLEDAVHFVEHLRNAEGVTEFSVHSLAPVQLAMRAYYRVEAVEPVADAVPAEAVAPAASAVPAEAVAAEAPAVLLADEPTEAPRELVPDVAGSFAVDYPTELLPEVVPPPAAPLDESAAPQPLPLAPDPDPEPEPAVPMPAEPVLPVAENGSAGRRGLGFFSR